MESHKVSLCLRPYFSSEESTVAMPAPCSRSCPDRSYPGAWTLIPGPQLGERTVHGSVQICSLSDMVFPIFLTFVQNAPWRHVYRIAMSANDILYVLRRCHIGNAAMLSSKWPCELNMTQLLSGLHTQGILCQQTVRGAEVGLEKGEKTSFLQHSHFSRLYWCIVEISFITELFK